MLLLQKLQLTQFRNYPTSTFNFTKKIVAFCGANGVGKTNLLDAIYYLSFTKSYFNRSDASNVLFAADGFRLEANFVINNNTNSVLAIYRNNKIKDFLFDGDAYKKLSHHIGKLPCVIITPDDTELIIGNSDNRRKFLDLLLSQIDNNYLQHLINYNKNLLQRNSLLKQYAATNNLDTILFDIITQQLSNDGTIIYNFRKKLMDSLLQLVNQYYGIIANKTDGLQCVYQSQLHHATMQTLLQQNQQHDFTLQRTNYGIHKDEIDFMLLDNKFKTHASQGQRKSLLFALKLAEFFELKKAKGFEPILLLDDVFEKLDADRMINLLTIVCNQNNGQVFITDTHKQRILDSFSSLNIDIEIFDFE
jgi:DNA replication and repair protein RecF